jgi:hypothetical protein
VESTGAPELISMQLHGPQGPLCLRQPPNVCSAAKRRDLPVPDLAPHSKLLETVHVDRNSGGIVTPCFRDGAQPAALANTQRPKP